MPPRSSAQIIDSGEYLDPGFDPSTLTIPHLLSIFTFHQIHFPFPYNKSKLVETFNEQVKPRAGQFRRDRLKTESSIASSRGIIDGLTGGSLSEEELPAVVQAPPPRRSSRRLSRQPSDPPPSPSEPPKRRRSSAGPTLSHIPTSRAAEPTEPALLEESEPEDEPVKKVGRPRKSVLSPGPQARRISEPDDMEGWSDNNVFQSGAESSSPARPSPKIKASIAPRRTTRRGRTSLSAPPQMPSSSPFAAPSTAEFGPRIPAVEPFRRFNRGSVEHLSPVQVKTEPRSSSPIPEAQDEEEEEEYAEGDVVEQPDGPQDAFYDETQALVDDISRTLAAGDSKRARQREKKVPSRSTSLFRLATYVLTILTSMVLYSYKAKSVAIGYCDSGTNTNAIIEQRKASIKASEECMHRLGNGSGSDESVTCDPLPFIRPEPMTCTPCPSHASCTPSNVTCDDSFVQRPHPFAEIPLVPSLLNGLPGFGPIAFPPKCMEDEARKRRIGSIGTFLRHRLAVIRGDKLCSGKGVSFARGTNEAIKWGTTVDFIHDDILKRLMNAPKRKGKIHEFDFDKIFKEAVSNLEQYGEIVVYTEPKTQQQYIASNSVELDMWCKAKLAARDRWNEWKGYMLGTFVTLACILWLRRRHLSQQAEANRVAELVQVALDTLRNQEMSHHIDPVSTPYSHLSSIHLRDLILQDEHSIPVRRALWDKVEKIVEGNANVRATMEELEGGDVGRVWRWVGSTAVTRSP